MLSQVLLRLRALRVAVARQQDGQHGSEDSVRYSRACNTNTPFLRGWVKVPTGGRRKLPSQRPPAHDPAPRREVRRRWIPWRGADGQSPDGIREAGRQLLRARARL